MDKLKKVSKYIVEVFDWERPNDTIVLITGPDTRVTYAGMYGVNFKKRFENLLNAMELRD